MKRLLSCLKASPLDFALAAMMHALVVVLQREPARMLVYNKCQVDLKSFSVIFVSLTGKAVR